MQRETMVKSLRPASCIFPETFVPPSPISAEHADLATEQRHFHGDAAVGPASPAIEARTGHPAESLLEQPGRYDFVIHPEQPHAKIRSPFFRETPTFGMVREHIGTMMLGLSGGKTSSLPLKRAIRASLELISALRLRWDPAARII